MAFLEMKKITKTFGSLVAVDQVDMSVEKGSIHALLGENGAGKSTLMNILYGLYKPTEGTMWIDGKESHPNSPNDAICQGVGMVHQHFMLVQPLTVIENVVLGQKRTPALKNMQMKEAADEFSQLAARYDMEISPYELVSNLTIGDQQRLEILKALFRKTNLLILDEPTAVLTPQETTKLFELLRQLSNQGLTVILITHKLPEVFEVCDSCTVLRNGKLAARMDISKIDNSEQLARLMVGEDVDLATTWSKNTPGREVLKIDDLVYKDEDNVPRIDNLKLSVNSGEIVGIAGVEGNGQSELARCVTGLLKPASGHISICGNNICDKTTKEILRLEVAHIPEDRHKMAMVSQMTINENLILMCYDQFPYSKHGFLNWKYITEENEAICREYNVKAPNINTVAGKLSGGNQQKFVIGRELAREPELIIAAHPSRGLDIAASKYIRKRLIEERDRGAAVLLISTDLEEIMELSDRIVVMYKGQNMGSLSRNEAQRDQIGLLMAGIQNNSKNND